MSNARSRKDKCRKVFCIPELVAKKNQMQQRPLLLSLCSLVIMGWKTNVSTVYNLHNLQNCNFSNNLHNSVHVLILLLF